MAELGFAHAELGGNLYWDESAAYEFSSVQIDALSDATAEIERICLLACAAAVAGHRHAVLGIPEAVWPLVVRSWQRREPSLDGRLDLSWDGVGPPKLLEYNADTPTALYEAAVVQWDWLQGVWPGADQFNSIYERLVAAWPGMGLPGTVHFASMRDNFEDKAAIDYLRDTALQAGLQVPYIVVEDIGWNGTVFTSLNEEPIRAIFKLYPWEWLLHDRFGSHVARASTRWFQPAWRLLLSRKGLLALLWEMFPDHPNLLVASRMPGQSGGPEIAKPVFGRKGANIIAPGFTTDGPYTGSATVYQAYREPPCFGGRHPVIGSWIVTGQAAGIGIREDATPITQNTSQFVPHYFR